MKPGFGELKARIEESLDNYLAHDVNHDKYQRVMVEAMRYAVLGEASRRRPLLVMLAAELFEDNPYDAVMPLACGIEICHAASLVMDDLPQQDGSRRRRGKPALHIEFDEQVAQLATAHLNAYCWELALTAEKDFPHTINRTVRAVVRATGLDGLVTGQLQDLRLKATDPLALNELEVFYGRKTANFIGAIASSPAILYGKSAEAVRKLYNFGRFVGLALQFADDVNSAVGGGKEDDGKLTAVSLLRLEGTQGMIETYCQRALKELEYFPNAARLRDSVNLMYEQLKV